MPGNTTTRTKESEATSTLWVTGTLMMDCINSSRWAMSNKKPWTSTREERDRRETVLRRLRLSLMWMETTKATTIFSKWWQTKKTTETSTLVKSNSRMKNLTKNHEKRKSALWPQLRSSWNNTRWNSTPPRDGCPTLLLRLTSANLRSTPMVKEMSIQQVYHKRCWPITSTVLLGSRRASSSKCTTQLTLLEFRKPKEFVSLTSRLRKKICQATKNLRQQSLEDQSCPRLSRTSKKTPRKLPARKMSRSRLSSQDWLLTEILSSTKTTKSSKRLSSPGQSRSEQFHLMERAKDRSREEVNLLLSTISQTRTISTLMMMKSINTQEIWLRMTTMQELERVYRMETTWTGTWWIWRASRKWTNSMVMLTTKNMTLMPSALASKPNLIKCSSWELTLVTSTTYHVASRST